ncbi:MAG: copper-binding protein [Burkholderiales bacterium]
MLRLSLLALALGLVTPLAPAAPAHDHAAMQPAATAARAAPAEGEVRKVDSAKGKVVLKHGPLVALDMPPMTMEFTAKDPKALASLKVGDKVRFTPEQAKDGTLLVTAIEPVRN